MRLSSTLLASVALCAATLVSASPAEAIVGGTAADTGRYSFMASIQDGDFHFCGGSVIDAEWVLTAAHCVSDGDPSGLTVVLGATDNGNGTGTRIVVDRIEVHPGYDTVFDAALLHLAQPTTITPIALPDVGDDALETDGTTVTVAGWGDRTPIVGGGLLTTNRLQHVDLEVVGDDACNSNTLAEAEVCAAAFLKDSCQGDSGGPLFGTDHGQYTQIGIVSYGLGCAVPNSPGVYAEVNNPSIRAFIAGHTGV